MKRGLQRDAPLDIHPYPDNPPPKLNVEINGLLDELGECAKKHPFWFSAGAVAAGVGGIMLGPGLVTLGQGVMAIGGILIATGMLSVVYTEKEQAEKWISTGLLTLVAGAGIALAGFALTTAGVVAVVAGSGVATKATVEEVLRRKIEKQMREKSISELIGISRQLNG
ncbi:hypothetical protein [Pontiella sulfatireligans]|uniref:hypothetical protein n=1 Tax=Pontiella sulfatireligans TaxID=2750658 RepID=UPI001443D5C6|nr:hypothetical protein [Pontiella sulfatireligans]